MSLFYSVAAVGVAAEDELLPADKAFQLTARIANDVLEATWQIAPGYYLYRDKFRFQLLGNELQLKTPEFPKAKLKQDPYFGETAIYTERVVVRVPFVKIADTAGMRIRVFAQGCNEPIGVCYPPITKELALALPVSTAELPRSSVPNSSGSFAQSFGITKSASSVIDPEKAFFVEAANANGAIQVRFTIDDCCYLYRDKMRFSLSSNNGKPLPTDLVPEFPPAQTITDEYFGRVEIYRRTADVRLPLRGTDLPADVLLNVIYQGCSDKGVKICYPPTTRQLPVQITEADAQKGISAFLLAMLGAFTGGLLLTFTPCVLPMIPILSGVIVKNEGTRLTKLRGALLSYSYVLGTALTYTIAGTIAGATGAQLQASFQNPWAIGVFSAVLLLLALSMFGFYELQLPSSIQSLLHNHSHSLHRRSKGRALGEFVGVFVLGAISALIIGACVSPVLVAALGGAIAAHDPWLGAGVMFALAHGQGAILVAIGVSEGALLPRAGPWMNTVKHIFGVLLIAVAISLLGALPQVPVLFLWAALFVVCAIYLGATQALPKSAPGWKYLQKGLGTFLLLWGVVLLIGGFSGNRDVFKPLSFDRLSSSGEGASADTRSFFIRVGSVAELDAKLQEAKANGKPAILDYYATWCTDCVSMERSTFRDAQIRNLINQRFVALQVDVTEAESVESVGLRERFGIYGPPALLFFGSDGNEHRELRSYGYQSASQLLSKLSTL